MNCVIKTFRNKNFYQKLNSLIGAEINMFKMFGFDVPHNIEGLNMGLNGISGEGYLRVVDSELDVYSCDIDDFKLKNGEINFKTKAENIENINSRVYDAVSVFLNKLAMNYKNAEKINEKFKQPEKQPEKKKLAM